MTSAMLADLNHALDVACDKFNALADCTRLKKPRFSRDPTHAHYVGLIEAPRTLERFQSYPGIGKYLSCIDPNGQDTLSALVRKRPRDASIPEAVIAAQEQDQQREDIASNTLAQYLTHHHADTISRTPANTLLVFPSFYTHLARTEITSYASEQMGALGRELTRLLFMRTPELAAYKLAREGLSSLIAHVITEDNIPQTYSTTGMTLPKTPLTTATDIRTEITDYGRTVCAQRALLRSEKKGTSPIETIDHLLLPKNVRTLDREIARYISDCLLPRDAL